MYGVMTHGFKLNLQPLLYQLYIGSGNLRANTSYTVRIQGLRDRLQTQAYINNAQVLVDYLVTVDTQLDLSQLAGDVFIGGYQDVSNLRVRYGCHGKYLYTVVPVI